MRSGRLLIVNMCMHFPQAEEAWRERQAAEVRSRHAARTIQKSWHVFKVKADADKKKAAAAEKKKGKGKGAAKGKAR